MNYQYHRGILLASDINHPYVIEASNMLFRVEESMQKFVNGEITIKQYVNDIGEYDEFMYKKAKEKPQKTNPINTMQNKKYSSWREQKWAPIWSTVIAGIQPKWEGCNLTLVQNKKVVESVYSNNSMSYKDVDGGIAITYTINGQSVLVPVVSVEDKGGHACSTCFAGVNAQGTRLHQSFKNAKQVFITDNNISVGKDKGIEAITDINLVISERGKNKVTEEYPSLNAEIFEEVRDGMIEKLGSMKPDDFTSYDIIPVPINESYKFRDDIDTNSIVWNWGNKG